jgi:transposase-like protein
MVNGSGRYDDEFKTHAVKMVVEQDRTISAVASDLGVSQPNHKKVGPAGYETRKF